MKDSVNCLNMDYFALVTGDMNIKGLSDILKKYSPEDNQKSINIVTSIINTIHQHNNSEYVYKLKDKYEILENLYQHISILSNINKVYLKDYIELCCKCDRGYNLLKKIHALNSEHNLKKCLMDEFLLYYLCSTELGSFRNAMFFMESDTNILKNNFAEVFQCVVSNPDDRIISYFLKKYKKDIGSSIDFTPKYISIIFQAIFKATRPSKYILKRLKVLSEVIDF